MRQAAACPPPPKGGTALLRNTRPHAPGLDSPAVSAACTSDSFRAGNSRLRMSGGDPSVDPRRSGPVLTGTDAACSWSSRVACVHSVSGCGELRGEGCKSGRGGGLFGWSSVRPSAQTPRVGIPASLTGTGTDHAGSAHSSPCPTSECISTWIGRGAAVNAPPACSASPRALPA